MREGRAVGDTGTMKGRSLRPVAVLCLMLTGIVAFPVGAVGQSARPRVEEGNRLYSEGRFDEAHQKYLEALLDDPDSPLIRFNDGNALYQTQDFQRAMERFQEALEGEDPALISSVWYNLGNALYRQQQLQESIEAYKEALRANPSDTDAKHNLERVLEQLQQQDQQQDQQPQQGGEEGRAEEPQGSQGQQPPPSEGQRPEGQDPRQEESNPRESPQGADPSSGEEEQEAQERPQPRPGEMTPEEAERLLNAIREDLGDVNRRRVPSTGKRPRKDW